MGQLTLSVCKESGIGVLRLLGVFRLFRWINRDRLTILTYHSVLPETGELDAGEARNVVDTQMFAWQMRYLARHCCCLRLEEAVELLRTRRPLPRYSVVVTFDDGFRNNLRYAYPILRRFGVPATIFVTTGHIGRGAELLWTERVGRLIRGAAVPQHVTVSAGAAPLTVSFGTAGERDDASRLIVTRLKSMRSHERDRVVAELERTLGGSNRESGDAGWPNADRYTFLTWSEVQKLAQGGMTIGSHTVAHPIMSSLDDERRVCEVTDSKREIERQLGMPCTLFSYPNGTADDFGDRDKAAVQDAGYVAAVTQIAGVNDERTDLFRLKRLNIGRGHGKQVFLAQLSGFWPWMRSLVARRSPGGIAPIRLLAGESPNGANG